MNDSQGTVAVLHKEADKYLLKAMDSTCTAAERKHYHELAEHLSQAEKMIKEDK